MLTPARLVKSADGMEGSMGQSSAGSSHMFDQGQVGYISGGNFTNATTNIFHNVYNTPSPSPGDNILQAVKMLEKFVETRTLFRKIHRSVVEQKTRRSGESFRARVDVQQWLISNNGVLWVTGGPGAGKTYLASSFVDWVKEEARSKLRADVAIIYAYFCYDEPLGHYDIILDLLIQLVQDSIDVPEVPTVVKQILLPYAWKDDRPPFDVLATLFKNVVRCFRCVSIIADSIDEMVIGARWLILELFSSVDVRLLLTSRPLHTEETKFKARLDVTRIQFIDFAAQSEDLDLFLHNSFEECAGLAAILQHHGSVSDVVHRIKEQADGMFLYAALQMELLRSCRSVRDVYETIGRCPLKIEDMYAQTMRRVASDELDLVQRTLLWVLYAKRALTTIELQHVISVPAVTYHFEANILIPESVILSLCRGLVTVDSRTQSIRFRHPSAHRPLAKILNDSQILPHTQIASTCIARLQECHFQHSNLTTMGELKEAYRQHPLLEYAHSNAAFHIRQAIQETKELKSVAHRFIRGCRVYPYTRPLSKYNDTPGDSYRLHALSSLHLAAAFNLSALVARLIKHGENINMRAGHPSGCGLTSLMIAALEGNESTMEMLVQHPRLDVNMVDDFHQTALFHVCKPGHDRILLKLIALGSDVNHKDKWGRSVLSLASQSRHENAVRHLLAVPGIDVNSVDQCSRSPLALAAAHGYTNIVSRLLGSGRADINQVDYQYSSPLLLAASGGHLDVVVTLLAVRGIDIAQLNKDGQSALGMAALNGHNMVVKALVEAGIDVNQVDDHRYSPLLLASENGHLEVVTTLIHTHGINLTQTNQYGNSALALAALNGHNMVVKVLLEVSNLEVNKVDNEGYSALLWASRQGHWDIVGTLLGAPGICITQVDEYGNSALALAAAHGHVTILAMLTYAGMDINQPNHRGRSPLMQAASKGHLDCVNTLLTFRGIDTTYVDEHGESALALAAASGHDAVLERLIEAGLDVNQMNHMMWPPLLVASQYGHLKVVWALLGAKGIDTACVDQGGRSALMLAAFYGHTEIVNALLAAGLDVNQVDNDQNSSLLLASWNGQQDLVRDLLAIQGLDPARVNKSGSSALTFASQNGHIEVVELLLEAGLDVNQVMSHDSSPLLLASWYGHLDVVNTLLRVQGINLTQVDKDGDSALANATFNGHDKIVRALIKAGVGLHIGDEDKSLIYPSANGHCDVVRTILGMSTAQINTQIRHGLTAAMCAAYQGQLEVLRIFINDPRTDFTLVAANGETIVLLALSHHQKSYHNEFLKYQPDLDQQPTALLLLGHPTVRDLVHQPCNEGWTPLMRACMSGYVEVVRSLLDLPGCDINATTKDGKATAMKVALEGGHDHIVQLLKEWKGYEKLRDDSK